MIRRPSVNVGIDGALWRKALESVEKPGSGEEDSQLNAAECIREGVVRLHELSSVNGPPSLGQIPADLRALENDPQRSRLPLSECFHDIILLFIDLMLKVTSLASTA
jgi:hypothetical protein